MKKDTLWLFNIAMENGPFKDDFPIETSIYSGFSMAMLNNQMVVSEIFPWILHGDSPWTAYGPRRGGSRQEAAEGGRAAASAPARGTNRKKPDHGWS